MTAPNKPLPVFRPVVPPAPLLTKNGYCSDCQVRAVPAGNDELKVCPRCYAMLWHADWSAEARKAREEAALAREVERLEVRRRNEEERRQRQQRKISAEGIITSAPEIGAPTLTPEETDRGEENNA